MIMVCFPVDLLTICRLLSLRRQFLVSLEIHPLDGVVISFLDCDKVNITMMFYISCISSSTFRIDHHHVVTSYFESCFESHEILAESHSIQQVMGCHTQNRLWSHILTVCLLSVMKPVDPQHLQLIQYQLSLIISLFTLQLPLRCRVVGVRSVEQDTSSQVVVIMWTERFGEYISSVVLRSDVCDLYYPCCYRFTCTMLVSRF